MDLTLIMKVLVLYIVYAILAMAFCGFLFWVVKVYVRGGHWPKWSYIVWAVCTLVLTVIMWKGPVDICLDLKDNSFVTYKGYFIERGGGYNDLDTIVIFDEDGNEIKLFHSGSNEVGEYFGEIIYGERSKIIVEYNGEPKN